MFVLISTLTQSTKTKLIKHNLKRFLWTKQYKFCKTCVMVSGEKEYL